MTTARTERISEPSEVKEIEAAAAPVAKKKGVKAYAVLGAVVAAGAALYAAISAVNAGKETTDDAQVDADVVPISARVGGLVLQVLTKDNQAVKKGEVLVEIDPADLDAKAKQAEADLEAAKAQAAAADAQVGIVEATSKGGLSAARAQLSGSASSVGSADAQVESARAALLRAQAEAARADTDLKRAESLKKDEAIPQAQVDSARTTAQAAEAAVAQARANLAVAEESKRTAQTRIAEAQGRVEQSAPVDAQLAAARAGAALAHARVAAGEASLRLAKLQLSYTKIEAAADGTLSKLAVREGQQVQAGQPIVYVVPTATYVVANFKETQVGEMKNGQRAKLEIDAFPGRTFEGVVQSTSPGTGARFSLLPPDNASGNFVKVVQRVPVKIAWTNLPAAVHPAAGMSADVTVFTR
jgi:membrane fusion protein (multidrug efflux system)